jgi:hypothetical protein
MDQVENLAEVPADPVEGVHHDRVAGTGVGKQLTEAVALDVGAGLLVDLHALAWYARGCRRINLPIEGLLGG